MWKAVRVRGLWSDTPTSEDIICVGVGTRVRTWEKSGGEQKCLVLCTVCRCKGWWGVCESTQRKKGLKGCMGGVAEVERVLSGERSTGELTQRGMRPGMQSPY